MTLPTRFTVVRILLAFLIMGLVLVPGWLPKTLALVMFLLASLTDWLDGYLARRFHQKSSLGILLDPIADKILVLGIFFTFVGLRLVPLWMVLVIMLRELLVTGVRFCAAQRAIILPAERSGKYKTCAQFFTIVVILWILTIQAFRGARAGESLVVFQQGIVMGSLWVTLLLTLGSGMGFFWRARTSLFVKSGA